MWKIKKKVFRTSSLVSNDTWGWREEKKMQSSPEKIPLIERRFFSSSLQTQKSIHELPDLVQHYQPIGLVIK